jgi:hypothetical protein
VRKGTFRQSALIEIRIVAGHPWHSGIGPGADRMIGVRVLGAADAADEMVGHFRHRQTLVQSKRQWLDIEVTGGPAGRAFDLEATPIVLSLQTALPAPGRLARAEKLCREAKACTGALR